MSTAELYEVDHKYTENGTLEVDISFFHGLGDIANFARLIPVYKKYNIDIGVRCEKSKEIIIKVAGGRVIQHDTTNHHKWPIQHGGLDQNPGNNRGWSGNKTGTNIGAFGLDYKTNREQLWQDLKEVDIQIKPLIPKEDWDIVDGFVDNWPKPLVLWHSIGNTNKQAKSFNDRQQFEFAYELLDRFDGTLLLLDWDSRATWTHHNRFKHLIPEFGSINLLRLAALMYRANLMIGIDSGPFYFSHLTSVPSVGVYFDTMNPAEYMIPTKRALTISTGARSQTLNRSKRFEFQTIDSIGGMGDVAEWCSRMLQPHRYLPSYCNIAADVQLQEIIKRKCRGFTNTKNTLSSIYDRNRSFDALFSQTLKHFPDGKVRIIEIGCIRADEDWGGAGFSTALFGRYVQLVKGQLISIDLDPNNCNYARNWCRQFAPYVDIMQSKGEDALNLIKVPIDILYLDSLDSTSHGHQEENLKEFKAAESKLHSKSIVCIDDTPAPGHGKGGLTVPYMLSKGWEILYAGYQVVLVRKT